MKTNKDYVNHPRHYNINWKGDQAIETYEYINSWEMGYAEGNIIKYVSRHKYKGKPLEDLRKAQWYLTKLIEQYESEGDN
tara:strand:+ start:879 stop:1118 length:240 start_codon:yes stop_codon:yes gene_type:complete